MKPRAQPRPLATRQLPGPRPLARPLLRPLVSGSLRRHGAFGEHRLARKEPRVEEDVIEVRFIPKQLQGLVPARFGSASRFGSGAEGR